MLVRDVSLELSESFLLVGLGLDLSGCPLSQGMIVLLQPVILAFINLVADLISVLQAVSFHALDLLLEAFVIIVLRIFILNHLRAVILLPRVLTQRCSCRHL